MGKTAMEILIEETRSKLNKENKEELLSLMNALNMQEMKDDPVLYLMLKMLLIDTRQAAHSLAMAQSTKKLADVEEALLILAKKMSIDLDKEDLTKRVTKTVEETISESLPDALNITVTSSDKSIQREVQKELKPILSAMRDLKNTFEIIHLKMQHSGKLDVIPQSELSHEDTGGNSILQKIGFFNKEKK